MTKRVSVTALADFQTCPWKYDYRWVQGLGRPPAELTEWPALAIGSAVHFGIEAALLKQANAVEAALLCLRKDVGVDRAAKFEKGIATAIAGVPQWVWDAKLPQVEGKLEVPYGDIVMVGKPDVWFVSENAIDVIDFKTTSSDEDSRLANYQLWNWQPRYYAVLIHDTEGLPRLPCYARHIVLSSRGRHAYGNPQPVDLDFTRRHMLAVAAQVGLDNAPHIDYHCSWCDYNVICQVRLTGGDWEAIARTYERREHHVRD